MLLIVWQTISGLLVLRQLMLPMLFWMVSHCPNFIKGVFCFTLRFKVFFLKNVFSIGCGFIGLIYLILLIRARLFMPIFFLTPTNSFWRLTNFHRTFFQHVQSVFTKHPKSCSTTFGSTMLILFDQKWSSMNLVGIFRIKCE